MYIVGGGLAGVGTILVVWLECLRPVICWSCAVQPGRRRLS
ncbi:hypothetical protein DSUL_50153 [Desulfovibrionales bacterium]